VIARSRPLAIEGCTKGKNSSGRGCEAYIAKPILRVTQFLETVQDSSDSLPVQAGPERKQSRQEGGFFHSGKSPFSERPVRRLFHFVFLERDMLGDDRIIFAHLKLFGLLTRVLLCRVEIARYRRNSHELYENGALVWPLVFS